MLGEIQKAKTDSTPSSSGSLKQLKRSELPKNTMRSTSSFGFSSSIMAGVFVLSLVVLILKNSPLEIRASDDEYSQTVQSDFLAGENAGSFLRTRRLDSQNQTDQTNSTSGNGGQKNGTCVVNAARTGIDCNSVLLRDLSTGSTKSGVYADLSRTFDPDSKLFETTGTVYLSYLNVTRQVIMNFEFNSSTPDGTILSQGSTPLGTIAVPLSVVNVPTNFGLSQIPYLPVDVKVVHQAVLSRDPELSDSGSGSTSTSSCGPNLYCESGSVTGTIGLIANGAVVVPQQFTLIVNVSEPTSGAFNLPFNDTISVTSNSTTYCDSLSFSSKATQDLTVRVQVCLPQAPCFGEDQTFAVGQDNQTLTNDLCFTPSFHLATNSTNGGGSGSNNTTHAPTTAAPGNSTTGGGF